MTFTTVALSAVRIVFSARAMGLWEARIWPCGSTAIWDMRNIPASCCRCCRQGCCRTPRCHQVTYQPVSDSANPTTQRRTQRRCHRWTKPYTAPHTWCHLFPTISFHLVLDQLIPSASEFFITSVYLQLPAEVSVIFLVCKPFGSTPAWHRVCSRPSTATYFASSSHRRRYKNSFSLACSPSGKHPRDLTFHIFFPIHNNPFFVGDETPRRDTTHAFAPLQHGGAGVFWFPGRVTRAPRHHRGIRRVHR